MKVVLAFDSWKESVSAVEACGAAARGIARCGHDVDVIPCPLSDGGEGFAQAMALAGRGTVQTVRVTGPLFEPVSADIVLLEGGRRAVVEAAQACGLERVPADRRSPGKTTTVGLGELLAKAVAAGAREIVVGLGGSATNDAGMGMLSALGWKFLDGRGMPVRPVGDSLSSVERIEPGAILPGVRIVAACDVRNPLFGPHGAAHVYAPQKGATPEDVARLDQGLRHFADVCGTALGRDGAALPGAGAAGGLGFALLTGLGAEFRAGAELAIELSGLAAHLQDADLCLTGEGRTDAQTACGKLPAAVAACSREAGVPCVCLSGSLGQRWQECYHSGFTAIFSVLQQPVTLAEALAGTRASLADAAEAVTRLAVAAGSRRVNP